MAAVDVDQTLRPDFYARYGEIYGYAHRHLGLEVATCRLTASGPKPEVKLQAALVSADTVADAALKGYRPVYFTELNEAVTTPIYDRARLPAGATFAGPAIVEEKDSTAVIGPRSAVVVDAFANLIVTLTWE